MNKKELLKNFTEKLISEEIEYYPDIDNADIDAFLEYFKEKIMKDQELYKEFEETISDIYDTMKNCNKIDEDWVENILGFLIFTYDKLYGRL